MRNSTLPTALERLIEPLPNDLKAAVLEAWKNEDIPHDENDSVYRLMVLLTLYARFYQDIATSISAAASKIGGVGQGGAGRIHLGHKRGLILVVCSLVLRLICAHRYRKIR